MEHEGIDTGAVELVPAHPVQVHSGISHPSPKKVLKSLKRIYTKSITCLETHMQLTSYQSTIHKKLALKAPSKEDLSELRRICEELIYIIQGPHDKGIYTTALRLLSSIATSPDSIAFILLERHVNPNLRNTLRDSTELPHEKSTALLLVLDHLNIRHQISLSRHTITHVAAKAQPDAADLVTIEEECKRLIKLAEENPEEIWVNLMVQDLLASVAKYSTMSFTLLEQDIYPRLVKISSRARKILLFDRLSRPLTKLMMQNNLALVEMRRSLLHLLVKPIISSEDTTTARDIYTKLLRLVSNGREREKSSAITLLENIAQSKSPLSWLLTEPEFYEIIEKMWALGTSAADVLYGHLQKCLVDRISAAEATITIIISGTNISDDRADQLVHIFRDLIEICKAHQVYDEENVDRAAGILLNAALSPEDVSFLLLDPALVDQYALILDGSTNSSQAKKLVETISNIQARKRLREAETVVSRLKHTRTWSGLDSDNVRSLCQTLVSSALNPTLRSLQDVAVNALVDLTKSPPDCAVVLLEPEFAAGIQTITLQPQSSGPTIQLANAMASLQKQGQLRADIPRLYKISNKRSFESRQEAMAFQESILGLVQLYAEYGRDESMSQLLFTSLLVVATGFKPAQEYLERGKGTQLITRQCLHDIGFQEALHEVMRQMDLSADRLLRQSELTEKDQGRFRIIFHRLIQLTRLDLDDWTTSRSVELLGALAKAPESAVTGLLSIPEIVDGLHEVARNPRNRRLAQPIARILDLLGEKEAVQAL